MHYIFKNSCCPISFGIKREIPTWDFEFTRNNTSPWFLLLLKVFFFACFYNTRNNGWTVSWVILSHRLKSSYHLLRSWRRLGGVIAGEGAWFSRKRRLLTTDPAREGAQWFPLKEAESSMSTPRLWRFLQAKHRRLRGYKWVKPPAQRSALVENVWLDLVPAAAAAASGSSSSPSREWVSVHF